MRSVHMSTKAAIMLVLFMLPIGAIIYAQAQPGPATWSNSLITFNFDAARGTYSITDKRVQRNVIENAFFGVNEVSSASGYNYTWNEQSVKDEVGSGKKIHIEGTKAGFPSLFLQVFIYNDLGFIVLNQGIKNTSAAAMRVKHFSPLTGIAYPGFPFDGFKMLDGESGMSNTKVIARDSLNCYNNLLATFGKKGQQKRSLVAGGLTYNEFQKRVWVANKETHLSLSLQAMDPLGKLVDPGATYIFKDKFYLDLITDNRFDALELYGATLKKATNAEVSGVTIPILNFWYAFVKKFGGDEFSNNSVGTVAKLEEIKRTGFLKYGPVGIRLEPDDYSLPNNQQGWWDDAHWQKYKGGQLLPPYQTIVKWGSKIRELGGVPFIYCQTAKRSEDYCVQHPDQMLFNSPWKKRSKGPIGWWGADGDSTAIYWTYDYTDPGFISHMKDVYANLKAGGVIGIKFDYPETGWSYDGGFEDKYATTTSAYRNIYKLAYEGLGPGRDVQERIPPFGDVALGVVTTQRTEGDNDRVYPTRIAKTGLRWYKNRMVVNYDCDPINPYHVYPTDSRDGWRAAISMTYATSGRMEIGKYFEKMTTDMHYDLSRAVPLLPTPAVSARPIDAFEPKEYPEVYDFKIRPDWHILTFYNCKIDAEDWPTDVWSYWIERRQFIPEKMIPWTIGVSLGDNTDDAGLGLDKAKKYYVFDFWNWKFVGKFDGTARLQQHLRPGESRVMAVHEVKDHPQFLSTNRHILQGYLDMEKQPEWLAASNKLAGVSKLVSGEKYKVAIAANGRKIKKCSATNATAEITAFDQRSGIYELTLYSTKGGSTAWQVVFDNKGR